MNKFNHGGDVYAISREKNISLGVIHDFSANINSFGPSKRGLLYINKALPEIVHYPDPAGLELKKAISERYFVKQNQILLGNGASELIFNIVRLNNIKNVIVASPTFSEYEEAANVQNLPVIKFTTNEADNFAITEDSYSAIEFDQSLVFLGHPNNPTGQSLEKDILLDILEKNKSGLVVVDESFIDFVGDTFSYRSLINEYSNLIVLHSFTKFYAIPGLRCAALYANEALIKEIAKFLPTWNINTLAQAYMRGALEDKNYYYQTQSYYKVEKQMLESLYTFLPNVDFMRTEANFYMLKFAENINIDELHEVLAKNNCFVRKCENFDALSKHYIRVAIKTHEENILLFQLIKEFLDA